MQTNQQTVPTVLPIPQTIGQELQAGGPKATVKVGKKTGVTQPVKGGLNLSKIAETIADQLESKRTTAVHAYLEAAKKIKEPANIADAQKVILETLQARQFPGAAARASEFGAVAYAWHYDPKATEIAVIQMAPKMKDGKEVIKDGAPIMSKPSETQIFKRIRTIRGNIPEGEPGHTKKGNKKERTGSGLNATQYARMLDYLKLMSAEQWDKYQSAYEGEAAARRITKPKAKAKK